MACSGVIQVPVTLETNGDSGRLEVECGEFGLEGGNHGLHHRRVEGVRGVEAAAGDALASVRMASRVAIASVGPETTEARGAFKAAAESSC